MMFQEMRRSDRKLNEDEVGRILAGSEYGVLSTTGTNGYPYGIPVSFVTVDGKICFHCALNAGSKAANIEQDAKVCFTVVTDVETLPDQFSTRYKSVVAFGQAELCDQERKAEVLKRLIGKYSKGFEEKGSKYIAAMADKTAVYEITIDHITGKGRKA